MPASRFRFYNTSLKAWSAMLAAIALAQKSIYLEMYIFEEDTKGFDFLSELERKAKEGVQVVLILDGLGSSSLKTVSIDRLRIAGVEVLFFSHFWKHTHRKMLIIDEQTVFVGGVNIGDRFALWRDLQMRLKGRQVARSAVNSFIKIYRKVGGKNPVVIGKQSPRTLERAKLWFIEHGMNPRGGELRKYYEAHIRNAEKDITLVTPYFIPRRWLIASLHNALLRGVRVTIIIPKHVDILFADNINQRFITLLHKLGATCVISPVMNHAKLMIIDSKEAIIGSHNLDALSFERNIEGGVFFEDKRMVLQLEKIIEQWIIKAEVLKNAPRLRWYDPIVALLLPLFESVL